jgi:hypothetical protein
MREGALNVINHSKNRSLIDASWEVVGSKNGEANAFKRTRNSLTRVDIGFVEAGQDAFDFQFVLAVLQQIDKVLARKSRREHLRRHKKSQRLLVCHMVTPSLAHVFHQPS